VASLNDENPDKMLPREASMVKLYATEVAKRVSLDGMQLMGGYGYSSEYNKERLVRQTLVSTVYGGTRRSRRTLSPRRSSSKRSASVAGHGGGKRSPSAGLAYRDRA
jgi:alkylation response protein AidB-like acyl-CoA dehydrogenase